VRRFPDLRSLAEAREAEVLRLWAGLGYYSRARSLLAAAREVASRRGGRLPSTPEELLGLPGIGPYTAAAVASIAFGRPHAVVDGNVARVVSRLFCVRGDPKKRPAGGRIESLAAELLDGRRPGDWNQAMMELGARVCLPPPEGPSCPECPLRRACSARRLGLQARLPRTKARPGPVRLRWKALRVERRGRVLLVKRDAGERLLPGHWGLPEPGRLPRARLGALLRTVRHSITRHRITLDVHAASFAFGAPKGSRWIPINKLPDFLISSLWRKAAGLAIGRKNA